MDIILASGSPRRKQLLAQMGIETFRVISSDADETVEPGLSPARIVEILSARKAEAVADHAKPGGLVIAADTIVALDDAVLGKPNDGLEAFRMLSALSGRRHQVYTGVTLLRDGERRTEHEVTTVTFRELTQDDITRYIATGEPMDKAGAYGIQGKFASYIKGIDGDYNNVVGLPVGRVYQEMKSLLTLTARRNNG